MLGISPLSQTLVFGCKEEKRQEKREKKRRGDSLDHRNNVVIRARQRPFAQTLDKISERKKRVCEQDEQFAAKNEKRGFHFNPAAAYSLAQLFYCIYVSHYTIPPGRIIPFSLSVFISGKTGKYTLFTNSTKIDKQKTIVQEKTSKRGKIRQYKTKTTTPECRILVFQENP